MTTPLGIDTDDHRDRSWMPHGACRGLDPATIERLFFPGQGDSHAGSREAKALCASCPVLAPCREYGMGEHFGIWGATTERERRHLRPAWRRAQERRAG